MYESHVQKMTKMYFLGSLEQIICACFFRYYDLHILKQKVKTKYEVKLAWWFNGHSNGMSIEVLSAILNPSKSGGYLLYQQV